MKSSNEGDTVYMMSESFLFCRVAGEGLQWNYSGWMRLLGGCYRYSGRSDHR